MRTRIWYLVGMILASLLTGCGSGDPAPPDPSAVQADHDPAEDEPVLRLDAPLQISLADLLTKPRSELAALAETCAEKVRFQRQRQQQGQLPFNLLPEARLPLAVPVWREATFSSKAGFSLPPYQPEDGKDNVLALHLARYGDAEAARRLADGDPGTPARIEALRSGRNYPVEWTRLVGLLLYNAEFGTALGDLQSAHQLVGLHRQLRDILDARAQQGPLGAALLSRGRDVLRQAADVWRKEEKRGDLAEQADTALTNWGDCPRPTALLTPGSSREEVVRFLGNAGKGRALQASSPGRALDLLGLPLPDEGADAVVACFDSADRLTELLLTYRPKLNEDFSRPGHLAHLLEESGYGAGVASPLAKDFPARLYRSGKVEFEVVLVPRNPVVGAFVRICGDSGSDGRPTLPRDFGAIHLNRSYEANRVRFAPKQPAVPLTVRDPAALARLQMPSAALALAEVVLEPETGHDVVARLTARYVTEQYGPRALAQIALPLWEIGGAARISSGGSGNGKHLLLLWEDAATQYRLRLPNTLGELPELEAADRGARQDLEERAERAHAWDETERQARLAESKPFARLPRELEHLKLGLDRTEFLALLPGGASALKRELPHGLLATFPSSLGGAAHVPRELFAHFDAAGRLDELRLRYTDNPAQKPGGVRRFLEGLKARYGEPETLPSWKARVWSDLSSANAGLTALRWQDDLTLLTCEQDSAGLDVALRNRPTESDSLRPVSYLPRGPEGCLLSMAKSDLFQHWGVRKPMMSGTAVVLPPKADSPYDALLVWFDNDRAVRIVARHTAPEGANTSSVAAGKMVAEAWEQEAVSLGWPRRRDNPAEHVFQSWANHDDVTRVRIFWQQSFGEAPRVFTEWKDLGVISH